MCPLQLRRKFIQRLGAATRSSGASVIFGFNTDVRFADTVYHVQSEAREHEHLLQTQVFLKGRCIGKHATSYAERMQQPGFREEDMHEMLKQQHRRFVEAVRAGTIESLLDTPEQTGLAVAAGTGTGTVAEVSPAMAVQPEAPAEPDPDATADMPVAEAHPAQPTSAPATTPQPDAAPLASASVPPKPSSPELMLKPAGGLIGKGLSLECLPSATDDGSEVTIAVHVTDENGPAAGAQVSCRITSGQAAATYVYATSGVAGVADVHLGLKDLDLATAAVLIQASHRGKSASRKYQLQPAS